MAFSMLPALRPGDWRAVICVRVCRKWAYRGGSDDGPIKHVDLVLVDQQGNSLYGEIPGPEVEAKSPLIDEGGVYIISRFRVSNAKAAYRPVDAPFMVEFTLHTTVTVPRTDIPDIPSYAYKITPIDALPAHAGDNKNFLDTIGTLVEVSDVHDVHLPNKVTSTACRHIVLRDLSYSEVKITLWGERALVFSTADVYNANEAKPITVLFVGGLMKSYQNNFYLSGNAACRWYFNPNIPEARQFYESFQNQRLEIRSVAAPAQQQTPNRVPAQLEEKNLSQMNAIGPYEFPDNGYRCTVTIGRLTPDVSWWFASCTKCSKSCARDGVGFRCGPCSNSSFKFKYKVSFTALDGTDEAEMVAFGDVARRMIGKPVQQLMRTNANANVYPAEIARLVSLRFTFAVTMTRQSFYKPKKTYNVATLVTSHGQPIALPTNVPHGGAENESAAESGSSSDKTATPNSSQASPDLLTTTPPSVGSLETPATKKHHRGESSETNKRSSCRRRLVLKDDSGDADGEGNSVSSAEIGTANSSGDGGANENHSPAHESG